MAAPHRASPTARTHARAARPAAADTAHAAHRAAAVQAAAVVVGVDGSLNGLAATEVAVDEAVLRHLPLRLAYATPPGHPHSNAPRMPTSVTSLVESVQAVHPELDISERIAPMAPSQLLLQEAENAALLVVGAPSHSERGEGASACTAHIVVDQADCPVVVAQQREPRLVAPATPVPL